MKKIIMVFFILFSSQMRADEGMWIPMLLDRNFSEMEKLGLKLTPEQIFSINNSSLKDAIVHFGGGCTAELISGEGLLLTNHHCGYGQIHAHSTPENNVLRDGFWAMSKSEEKPNPGLVARFLVRMEDVTNEVNSVLNDEMTERERETKINEISREIENRAIDGTYYTARVSAFYEGNEFYLSVYETFQDVRLVGTPPESIGKFGADTDNWVWPRHTGDFALFRIYMSPDGKPAPYSENNVPYKPKHYFPISLDGVKEGDFAMILGYPGRTDRFATSWSINNSIELKNPAIVNIRTKRLEIIDEFSALSPDIRLLYANKHAGIANFWKYSIGQTEQLKRNRVADKKIQIENEFREFAEQNPEYANVLSDIESAYQTLDHYEIANRFYTEAILNIEVFRVANLLLPTNLKTELEKSEPNTEEIQTIADRLKPAVSRVLSSSYAPLEQKNTEAMLKLYFENVPKDQQPKEFVAWVEKNKNDFAKMAEELQNSVFANEERVLAFLNNPDKKVFETDQAFEMAEFFHSNARAISAKVTPCNEKLRRANRLLVEGLRKMNPDKLIAPNANSTMRLTYGQVLSYYPVDAIHFDYKTKLTGVMEKEDSTSHEFEVPAKLKELYERKDFGIYGENGNVIVNFIFNGDITGGNSGSPVLNANGELIGCAFDGNWEAMSGDIFFENDTQRCINVDIRYILFIIDKFAGAKHLIDEMSLRAR
ncbi:MAG: S46 family peptidase [Bacteroidales bacterium]|nr:S46 family peptidase [Bacteroidales bacterium]